MECGLVFLRVVIIINSDAATNSIETLMESMVFINVHVV